MTTAPEDGNAWLEDSSRRQIPILGFCSIGRAASNQVVLPSEMVSRRHALIQEQHGQEFWLVDFGSSNGTYLNHQRITKPTRLHPGDQLKIGPFEFVFHLLKEEHRPPSTTILKDRTRADIRNAKCWLLVADIIGSTRLVKLVTLEELPVITGRWVAECKQTIEEHGGRINQFMGDGFFAYWQDRERCEALVAKALHALRRLQEQARPPFRLAVHLDEVAIGGVSVGEEERISGPEVHFAFRMEKLAAMLREPVLLSQSSRDRLSAFVNTRELGRHVLPGFESDFAMYGIE
jgi:class 3 adenylate cyclase